MPVFAVPILAVLGKVLCNETVAVAPNGLHDAGPWVPDADVARFARPRRNFLPVFINNDRVDSRHARTSASRLHGIDRGLGAAQESSVFGLPPGVDNHRLTFTHYLVIPAPDFGFDRLSHRRHVLEMVVVLVGLVVTRFAQHANGGR